MTSETDWVLQPAQRGDHDAIVRLVYGDASNDAVKLLGTTERAIRLGNLLAAAWPGASWSATTVAMAKGAVIGVLQDGPSEDDFEPGFAFLRRVARELGLSTTLRALPATVALQRVRVPPPHPAWVIRELDVEPIWRNRGVGEQLLRHGEQRANDHDFPIVALSTRTNNPARRLYERLGYRMKSQRTSRIYAHVTGATGRILMTKTLRPPTTTLCRR